MIAVLCSDMHFWHKTPVARSAEEDWFKAMRRPIQELNALSRKDSMNLGEENQLPVICAGDVFDRWNPTPETINFLIRYLPKMYAVPGQHDLPNHRYEDIQKTGYWTLVEAGVITSLPPDVPVDVPGRVPIRLHGFPWGFPVKPLEDPCDIAVEVAVIHDYLWMSKTGYVGAPKEKRLKNRKDQFKGYNVAVVGDNHTPFDATVFGCRVFNCGAFLRRKADEKHHRPRVGLLYADGVVKCHYLETDEDRWLDDADAVRRLEGQADYRDFVDGLKDLEGNEADFETVARRAAEKARPEVRDVILKAMGGK